jgi:hypothetical protein
MNIAHDCFRERNYHFSFLNRSRTYIAYVPYMKLGYMDLVGYPGAHKVGTKSCDVENYEDECFFRTDL